MRPLVRLRGPQRKFLHSPIQRLGDVDFVFAVAIHGVDSAELFEEFPGSAEFTDDLSVERQLINFPIVQGRAGIRVGRVKELPWTGGDADRIRCAVIGDLRLEVALGIEYLDALVFPIADVDVVLGINSDRVRQVELAGLRPTLAPGLDELPVLIEFRNPGVAIPIRDEDISGCIPGHIGWPIKIIARDSRTRRRCGAPASGPRRGGFTSGNTKRFGFSTHRHQKPPIGIEFDDHV